MRFPKMYIFWAKTYPLSSVLVVSYFVKSPLRGLDNQLDFNHYFSHHLSTSKDIFPGWKKSYSQLLNAGHVSQDMYHRTCITGHVLQNRYRRTCIIEHISQNMYRMYPGKQFIFNPCRIHFIHNWFFVFQICSLAF